MGSIFFLQLRFTRISHEITIRLTSVEVVQQTLIAHHFGAGYAMLRNTLI